MEHHSKLYIYKGMIQYILDSTHYTLKHIAQLSDATLDNICMIYCHERVPQGFVFKSEIKLLKLYQIILEVNIEQNNCSKQVRRS